MTQRSSATLRVVLGDQLSPTLSALRDLDPQTDVVLMAEVAGETDYVAHHPKKIAFLFSAMRHFAAELAAGGIRVRYTRLDDRANTQSLAGEVRRAASDLGADRIVATEPGEYRVREDMETWAGAAGVPAEIREDDRFFCSLGRFRTWADGRKQLRMEYFYREMRRASGLLMEMGDEPAGGRWNFDAENRKKLPAGEVTHRPQRFEPDALTREVLELVGERFGERFGDLEPFWFAVTRAQALAALEDFAEQALPRFGDYQDAMRQGDDWLYHSALSQYLNCGLLLPREICERVERAWRDGDAPLNAVEGYIRQILGWREYVRGLYWLDMPGYAEGNALGANRPLPTFYWTGRTDMNCVAQVVGQTRREAHSHHIQRLMITGNFALLAGIVPAEVCAWYLAVYADAYEWVELPNTLGMALFADGGRMASKPYAASGAYIDRMSDFCGSCHYDVRQKSGPGACPFNYLYWNFMMENRPKLARNPRLGPVYKTLDRMAPEKREAALRDSAWFLAALGDPEFTP